jgi:Concanavalin A-like lectin/glucanases superfamily/Glycoside hydrolase 123, catalytic domain
MNLKKIIIPCLLLLTVVGLAQQKPLVHWNFDQIKNNTLKDVSGNCDGKIKGGSVEKYIRLGLEGNAFYFDSGMHYIQVPHSKNISLKNNFTVEYIIKPFRVNSYRTIIWKGNRKQKPEAINYFFDIRDGKPELKTKDAAGKWIVYASKSRLKPKQWYHVIITYNNGECEFYINGKKKGSTKHEEGKIKNSLLENTVDACIGVGANARSKAYFFYGLIDDIKIWKGRVVNIDQKYGVHWRYLKRKLAKRTVVLAAKEKLQAEKQKQQVVNDYKSFFKNNAKSTKAPFIASSFPSSSRLVKESSAFKKIKNFKRKIAISAARNEYEGFQIITFANPEGKSVNVKATVSKLSKINGDETIPESNISIGFMKSITSEKPDIPVDFTGEIPDAILNGKTSFEVKPYDFSPLYVKIFTGNAKPGIYTGELTLTCGEFQDKIKIKLNVYNFTLPQKGTLKTAFSFFEKFYLQWYNLKSIPDNKKRAIYDFLLSYRLSPNNIYTREAVFPNVKLLKEIKNQTNFFTIRSRGIHKPLSTEQLKEAIEKTRESIKNVKANGLQNDMYYYSYDEILSHFSKNKLTAVTQINTALKKEFPELRMMQTSFPDKRIENLFNVWVPIISYFSSAKKRRILDRLKKRGDEIWWYGADEPYHPYPNYFLDYPVFDCRIIMTLSYMYKVKGILYWCINREWKTNTDINKQWPDASWKPYIFHMSRGTRKYKNGMGNLVYPGKNGELLPSLRLENLRDGLEDYEYLMVLKKLVAQKGNTALSKQAKKLLKVPANVAVAADNYSTDPENLINYRNKIASMIEKLKKNSK